MRTIIIIEDSERDIYKIRESLKLLPNKLVVVSTGDCPEEELYAGTREEIYFLIQKASAEIEKPIIFLIDERLGIFDANQEEVRGSSLVPTLRRSNPGGIFLCTSSHPPLDGPYDGVIGKPFHQELFYKFREALQKYL